MEFTDSREKEKYIRELFSGIAGCYDVMNSLLSFCQDRNWRKIAARKAGIKPGDKVLDSCCGTGRLSRELARHTGFNGTVTGVDFCSEMLSRAEKRYRDKSNMTFVKGNALNLPFPDNTFDAAVMGFALRNVADPEKSIKELIRVTVPGGSIVILELNRPSLQGFKQIFNFYFNFIVPRIGAAASGLTHPYTYLPNSYSFLPDPTEIIEMMQKNGAAYSRSIELTAGTAAVYWAEII